MGVSAVDKLRALLTQPGLISMPCCFDAFSARLIERAGFSLTFMSGFAALRDIVGFPAYFEAEQKYATND